MMDGFAIYQVQMLSVSKITLNACFLYVGFAYI